MIGILLTRGGKFLAFMLLVCLRGTFTTIMVLLLVALKQDIMRKCQDLGISCSVWEENREEPSQYGSSLLFVSAESASSSFFLSFVGQLHA